MRKQEAAITARIDKWFAVVVPQSSPWEVKHTRGKATFPFSEIAAHQRRYLYAATTPTGFTYKIPDIGFSHPPCDVVHYKNTPAYVIVVFPKFTTVLEIRDILALIEAGQKSISEDAACALSLWKLPVARLPK